MPLTMRPTGLESPVDKDRPDFTIFSGDWAMGRIYEDRGAPVNLRWFWSLHGIVSKPLAMRTDGRAPTLEAARISPCRTWRVEAETTLRSPIDTCRQNPAPQAGFCFWRPVRRRVGLGGGRASHFKHWSWPLCRRYSARDSSRTALALIPAEMIARQLSQTSVIWIIGHLSTAARKTPPKGPPAGFLERAAPGSGSRKEGPSARRTFCYSRPVSRSCHTTD